MDPTTIFCPNGHCHARGQTGRANLGIHAQKEQRFICHECHKTFSARKGTVFYRLRTSTETVVLVVTLLAHGCPLQAIVAAFGFDERTVADWWALSHISPLISLILPHTASPCSHFERQPGSSYGQGALPSSVSGLWCSTHSALWLVCWHITCTSIDCCEACSCPASGQQSPPHDRA
jgi:transposase-like protein